MCNCGNKRSQLKTQSADRSKQTVIIKPADQKMWADISFMYTGESALTVTGNVTGRRYRFNEPGEQQMIDYRDASFMLTVPVLKRID
jgi:hypothetical protein